MRNTGIEYTSAERTPTILPDLAELLPPLSGEQLAALEKDILQNGCYAPIIVNEDLVVVDGHNRQQICTRHDLPYKMAVFAFDDLLEAKQWALDTQKGRRNLDKWELGKIALKLRPEIEARAKANQGARTDLSATLPEGSAPVDTRKELAASVGLGERTMGKVMQIDEHAPAAVKEALDKKELSVNQGYQITRQVQDLPEDEQYREKVKAVAETLEVKGIRIAEIETMLRIDEEEEASARGVVPERKKAHRSVGIRHCDTREPCRSSHRILRPGIFKGISCCSGRSARHGIKN